MKIKKCCEDSNMVYFSDYVENEKTDKKVPCIFHIPIGCYEEEGVSVEIKYCPFCGKKIEVEE